MDNWKIPEKALYNVHVSECDSGNPGWGYSFVVPEIFVKLSTCSNSYREFEKIIYVNFNKEWKTWHTSFNIGYYLSPMYTGWIQR